MTALILAGEYPCQKGFYPWTKLFRNQNLIDATINYIKSLKFEPILVMGGDAGDELLRTCQQLREIDFVFDTTPTASASPATNLVAGLKAVNGACFALMPDTSLPEKSLWEHLRSLSLQDESQSPHIYYPKITRRSGVFPQYPLLITRRGVKELLTLSDLKRLTDSNISALETDVECEFRGIA